MADILCPYCRRHCDLSAPQCMQGKTYADRIAEAGGEYVPPDKPDINRQIVRCLRRLGRTITALSEGRSSRKRVLRLIKESGGITQQALTERLGVQPGTMSEVIGKLESAGLVRRTPNSFDRRTHDISLTPDGEAQEEIYRQEYDKRRDEMFAALSSEEKTELLRLLDKLADDWRERYHDPRK